MNNRDILCRYIYILICLYGVLISGCSRDSRRLRPYGWETTGEPSDQLLYKLDSLVYNYGCPDSISALADEYCKVSEKESDAQLYHHRRLYWKGTALFMNGEYEKGDSLRYIALENCDSNRFPHDYRVYRFAIERPTDFPDNSARYSRYISDLDAFIKYDDLASGFSRAVQISQLLSEAGMHERALSFSMLADSLLNASGLQQLRKNNRANIATCMFNAGDTIGAVKTLSSLKSDASDENNPVDAIINFNIFQMNGDTVALDAAWKIVKDHPEFGRLRPLVAAAVIKSQKLPHIASEYSNIKEILIEEAEYSYRPEELIYIKAGICDLAARNNDYPLLVSAVNEYESAVDDFIKELRRGELIAATIAAEVNDVEVKAERQHQKSMSILLILFFAAIIISAIVTILLILRINKLRQVELLTQIEVEQNKRRKIASAINGRMDLGKPLEKDDLMEQSGIRHSDKIPEGGKSEQKFMVEFINRYPKVGKTGRRLALYIREGLDTAQIAQEMNIRKESVMQARWRLRRQMELSPEDDLETVILNLNC